MLRCLLPLALAVGVFLCFALAVDNLDSGHSDKSLRQLEEALRRGCVACYSTEGAYPSSLDYLTKHYGIQIDEKRYTVHYTAIAENLMPDITVLENLP
jgi:hypothetical protein